MLFEGQKQMNNDYYTPPEILGQIVEAATLDRLRSIFEVTPSNGPGRPDETADIAALAKRLKKADLSWQQCFERCQIAFGEERVRNMEQLRSIWRRHFGKKKEK
jgi:hypothetical protein